MLEQAGHEVVDVGTDSDESDGLPASRRGGRAARGRRRGRACGARLRIRVGVSIVANKVDGVRA